MAALFVLLKKENNLDVYKEKNRNTNCGALK